MNTISLLFCCSVLYAIACRANRTGYGTETAYFGALTKNRTLFKIRADDIHTDPHNVLKITSPPYGELVKTFVKGKNVDNTNSTVILQAPLGLRVHLISLSFDLESNGPDNYFGNFDIHKQISRATITDHYEPYVADPSIASNFRRRNGCKNANDNSCPRRHQLIIRINYREVKEFDVQRFLIVYEFYDPEDYEN